MTRPNTLLIRTLAEVSQSYTSTYLVLAGVSCAPAAVADVIDWLELHDDFGRYDLIVFDWIRDSFGRLLGNLSDKRTGETLTAYLLQRGTAREKKNHLDDVMRDLLSAEEPEL